jgi:hypothetical protein
MEQMCQGKLGKDLGLALPVGQSFLLMKMNLCFAEGWA